MRITIFIIGLFFTSCSDSVGIYEGKLYTGQVLLSEGTDISNLSFGSLVAPPVPDIAFIAVKEDFKKMSNWEREVLNEINNAPESERFGKKLRYMCDYMEFIDLEFVKLITEDKTLETFDFISEKVPQGKTKYALDINEKIMGAVTYFFEITTKRSNPIPLGIQVQTHEFLKVNCPKYRSFMEIVEQNKLNNFEGKMTRYNDIAMIKQFLDRADKAIKPLKEEEKAKMYADAVCQALSRNPLKILNTLEEFQSKEGGNLSRLRSIENGIFEKRLNRLDIANNGEERRTFCKILAGHCPNYSSWVNNKNEQGYAVLGDKRASKNVNTSFTAPAVPFDNFKELKFYMLSMDSTWEKKQEESSIAEILEWTTNETCKLIEDLDLDYANNSNFYTWANIAENNYKFGVERPKDVKLLLYAQLLAYYGNLVKTGQLYNVKYKDGDYGFFHGWGVDRQFKKQLQEQCQKKQDKLSEICEKNYLKMDRELFGY